MLDEFDNIAFTGQWNLNASGAGAGATSDVSSGDNGHSAVVQLATGSTSAGYAEINKGIVLLGGGSCMWETVVKFSAASDSSDLYIARLGLFDSFSGTAPNNGVYFVYDSSVSANWTIKCVEATATTTSTSSTAVAATSWTRLTMIIAADGASARFYVNGTELDISPVTTANIPVAAIWHNLLMLKNGGSVGTVSRVMNVDYAWCSIKFTTPR